MPRPLSFTMQWVFAAVWITMRLDAQTPPAAPAPPQAAKTEAKTEPKGPATYVSTETCQGCHEEVVGKFAKNPHHALEADKSRPWAGKTCEACHGPGSRHADSMDPKDIRNPAKLPPAQSEKICLSCHLNTETHAGHIQSSHAKNQVACVSCHAMHRTPEELVARSAKAINGQCAGCHVAEWASFSRPYRHKLPEGAMSCVDCHDPHGRPVTTQARAVIGNQAGCFQCHGDKRGPFIFEHEPMRTDGCMACHVPHGSANPRMLSRNDEKTVCLECHANILSPKPALGGVPPAFHDLRNPVYQTCAVCHSKVHGSNVDRTFLR
jgi:DmsE family decaheme c-type cytochrome